MLIDTDLRVTELRLLETLSNGMRNKRISIDVGKTKQKCAPEMDEFVYADLIMTLAEDGCLHIWDDVILQEIAVCKRLGEIQYRNNVVTRIASQLSSNATASVTYRGWRRIEELRDQLRYDRILDRFGILLDGRYIVSDLIYHLEQANGEPVSVLFADADSFKRFNDISYQAGDAVLRHVFQTIRHLVGNRGEVYRWGGEEVLVLLPYCGLDKSNALAENIRSEVEQQIIQYEGQELQVTVSIGVAASPPCEPDGPRLERFAQIAQKQAKDKGKNRVAVSEC